MNSKRFVFRFFYPLALILFFADLLCAFTFHIRFVYFLLCLGTFMLATQLSAVRLSVLLVLLSLESWLINGHFGVPLIFFLPISLLIFKFRSKFYESPLVLALIAGIIISGQCIIVDWFLLAHTHYFPFTILQIAVNVLLTMSISLI